MSRIPETNRHDRMLLIAALLGLLLVLTLTFFSGPTTDDFSDLNRVEQHGVFKTVQTYYLKWTGRWTGLLVSSLLARDIVFERFYPAALSLIVLISSLGWAAVVRACWGTGLSWPRTLGVGLILQAFYYAGSPALGETVFWLKGANHYALAFALSQLLFLACLRFSKSVSRNRPAAWLGGALLLTGVFSLPGFNEILAVYWVLVLGTAAAIAFRYADASRWTWLAVAAAGSLGVAVVVLSPGNAIRIDAVETSALNRGWSWSTGELAGGVLLKWLPAWIFDVRVLLLSALYCVWPASSLPVPDWLSRKRIPWIRWIFPVWILGILIGVLIIAIAIGRTPPGRALSVVHAWVFLGWFLILTTAVRTHRPAMALLRENAFAEVRPILAVLVFFALLSTGNHSVAIGELASGTAARHRQNYRALHRYLREASEKGVRDVVIPPLPKTSRLLYHQRLSIDSDHWLNQQLSRHYGVRSLSIQVYEDRRPSPAEAPESEAGPDG